MFHDTFKRRKRLKKFKQKQFASAVLFKVFIGERKRNSMRGTIVNYSVRKKVEVVIVKYK